MNILTWNVFHGTPRRQLIKAVSKIALDYDVEVLCLQEVNLTKFWTGRVAGILGMSHTWLAHPHIYGLRLEGLAIISGYPIINAQAHRLSSHRGYLQACLAAPHGPLSVGCLHASKPELREQEVLRTLDILPSKNAVVAGDFNLTPGSAPIWAAGEQLQGDGLTAPTGGFDSGGKKIDYVFATPDLQISHAEILDAPVSDHRPLLATISPISGGG